MTQNTELIVLN